MRLLRRRPSLPADQRDGLRTAMGTPVRPLAVATGPDPAVPGAVRYVVALPTHLAYGSATDWTTVAWDQIDRGSWNGETSTLEVDQRGPVTSLGEEVGGIVERTGRRHRIRLEHPERVAQVMAERVAATILLHRSLTIPDRSAGVTVVTRRSLVDQSINWLAVPGRGLRADDPDVRSFAAAALRRLRREFA